MKAHERDREAVRKRTEREAWDQTEREYGPELALLDEEMALTQARITQIKEDIDRLAMGV